MLSLLTFAVSLFTMKERNAAALTTPDGELVGHYHMSDAAGFMTGEVLVIDDGWPLRWAKRTRATYGHGP